MYHPDQLHIVMLDDETPPTPPSRRACLVAGCPCKDARLVSRRQAAFFAALARKYGETADRVVAFEAEWSIGAFADAAAVTEVAA